MNEYEVKTTAIFSVEYKDAAGNYTDPTTVTGYIVKPDGTEVSVIIQKLGIGQYFFKYTIDVEGDHRYLFIGQTAAQELYQSGFFRGISYTVTGVDYLIPDLRIRLGEFVPTEYKYSTETLRNALVAALKVLMRKWRARYSIDTGGVVHRNIRSAFNDAEPPIIEYADEAPIILQATIILKQADATDRTWDIQSWKDDEISFSNLGASRASMDDIARDIAELEILLSRRLYGATRQELPGFKLPYNIREG